MRRRIVPQSAHLGHQGHGTPVRISDTASRATKCEQTNFCQANNQYMAVRKDQCQKNINEQNQDHSQHQTKEPIIKQLHNQTNLGGTRQHDQGDKSLHKANRRLICFDTNTATGTDNGVGTTAETSDTVINQSLYEAGRIPNDVFSPPMFSIRLSRKTV